MSNERKGVLTGEALIAFINLELFSTVGTPPFGSGERGKGQQNCPIKSGEKGYLCAHHFIRS